MKHLIRKDNEAYAILRNLRVSPSKANIVLEMIRGKKASEAINLLKFSSRGIAKDISNIPKAIQYFEDELGEAKAQIRIKGNVERAAAEMPGIVEQRFNQLQELEAILEYLNIELRRLRSSFFKKYLENYARALSSRDVEKYVDGEADVVDYEKIINEFALMRNKWLGVTKALDQKQWQLTNIVKLRVAGMEDASL